MSKKNQEGCFEISIRDNGCGSSAMHMKNVFVPFFTTKEEGSGIGLSIARQIMRLHNGNIKLESEEGKGTTVTIQLLNLV
ncbi:ATP-binding protein [Marinifilum sp.]|uniref:ATP-binding protein n=1 Tax=Marinifilum sp. TaxID=2033137 RepID=UPI003BABFCD5